MAAHTGHTSNDHEPSPEVEEIIEMTRTINEMVDVDKLMTFYADDALRVGPYTPGIFRGAAEIRADFEKRLAGMRSRTLDDIDLNVVTNGNYAVAYSQQKITETTQDGTAKQVTPRSQDVYHKVGDAWVVVVQHTSYVAAMQKMAAVTNVEFVKPGQVHWYEYDAPFPEPPISLAQAEKELHEWMIDDIHAQVTEQAMRYYGPGDYATVYDSRTPPGRMVGMWDIYLGWLGEMVLKHVDDELGDYRVWTDGQFAAIFSLQDIVATKLDGSTLVEQIRQLDCLHRVDGHWYSYVESVSWPFDEQTGRLVLNLPAETKS